MNCCFQFSGPPALILISLTSTSTNTNITKPTQYVLHMTATTFLSACFVLFLKKDIAALNNAAQSAGSYSNAGSEGRPNQMEWNTCWYTFVQDKYCHFVMAKPAMHHAINLVRWNRTNRWAPSVWRSEMSLINIFRASLAITQEGLNCCVKVLCKSRSIPLW